MNYFVVGFMLSYLICLAAPSAHAAYCMHTFHRSECSCQPSNKREKYFRPLLIVIGPGFLSLA
jgi:hypothetical protein